MTIPCYDAVESWFFFSAVFNFELFDKCTSWRKQLQCRCNKTWCIMQHNYKEYNHSRDAAKGCEWCGIHQNKNKTKKKEKKNPSSPPLSKSEMSIVGKKCNFKVMRGRALRKSQVNGNEINMTIQKTTDFFLFFFFLALGVFSSTQKNK